MYIIKNGDFPLACYVFWRVNQILLFFIPGFASESRVSRQCLLVKVCKGVSHQILSDRLMFFRGKVYFQNHKVLGGLPHLVSG